MGQRRSTEVRTIPDAKEFPVIALIDADTAVGLLRTLDGRALSDCQSSKVRILYAELCVALKNLELL